MRYSATRSLPLFLAFCAICAAFLLFPVRIVYALHLETFPSVYDASLPASTTAGVPVEFAVVGDVGDSSPIKYWRLDFNGDHVWDQPSIGRSYDVYKSDGAWWSYGTPSQNWQYEGYGTSYRYAYPVNASDRMYIVAAEVEFQNGTKAYASATIMVQGSPPATQWPAGYTNHAPVANAGGTHVIDLGGGRTMKAYLIARGAGLTLDASGSYDADALYGDGLRYVWVLGPDNLYIYTTDPTVYLSPEDYPFLTEYISGDINLMVIDRWGAIARSDTTFWDNSLSSPVPEPATLLLLAIGLGGIVCVRRKSGK
jgi:hypothetical protein